MINPLKMVIFHSYVSLPEGTFVSHAMPSKSSMTKILKAIDMKHYEAMLHDEHHLKENNTF